MICKKLSKGKKLKEIADDLEKNENDIKDMVELAVKFAPEFDTKKVFEAYLKEK